MRALACAVVLWIGCASSDGADQSMSSGISGSDRLSELTQDEAMALCVELAGDLPERLVTCNSGETFSAGYTESECQGEQPAPPMCEATVANLRDCAYAFYNMSDAALCASDSFPSQCDPLLTDECSSVILGYR